MKLEEEWKDDGKRHRGWAFTRNNWTESDENAVFALQLEGSSGCCGKEVGECGTPHLQGFVYFDTLKSFTQVKTMLPGARIAPKYEHSTFEQAWEYTKKDGDFFEWGKCPDDPKKKGKKGEDWYRRNAALCLTDPDAMDPSARFQIDQFRKSERTVERVKKSLALPTITERPCFWCEWHHGVTGSGKTEYTSSLEDAYTWTPKAGWNLYNFQPTVIFSDIDRDNCPSLFEFKTWTDRKPFDVKILYDVLTIRPTRFIVTTNEVSIEDMYPKHAGTEHVRAVKRRFRYFEWTEPFYLDEFEGIKNPNWSLPPGLSTAPTPFKFETPPPSDGYVNEPIIWDM